MTTSRRALSILILAQGCSAPQESTFEMTWRFLKDGTCPTMRHVEFEFTQYPAYRYGICSDDVARYLDGYGSRPIAVTFAIYEPDAQLGGGEPVRIGALAGWKEEFAHMGSYEERPSSVAPPHPWSALRDP